MYGSRFDGAVSVLIENRNISAKRFETDQVKNVFALIVGEMYPEGVSSHLTGRFLV